MPCPRQSTAILLEQCLCRHSACADLAKPMHRYRYPIPLRRCPKRFPCQSWRLLCLTPPALSMPLLVGSIASLCHASANASQRPCRSLPMRRLALRYHCSTDPWLNNALPFRGFALPQQYTADQCRFRTMPYQCFACTMLRHASASRCRSCPLPSLSVA